MRHPSFEVIEIFLIDPTILTLPLNSIRHQFRFLKVMTLLCQHGSISLIRLAPVKKGTFHMLAGQLFTIYPNAASRFDNAIYNLKSQNPFYIMCDM